MRKNLLPFVFMACFAGACGEENDDPNASGAGLGGTAAGGPSTGLGGSSIGGSSGSLGGNSALVGGLQDGPLAQGGSGGQTNGGGSTTGGTWTGPESGGAASGGVSSGGFPSGGSGGMGTGGVIVGGTAGGGAATGGTATGGAAAGASGEAASGGFVGDSGGSQVAGGAAGELASTGGQPSSSGGAAAAAGSAGEEEPCVVAHGGQVPSLREMYADHFSIGAAIDTQYSRYSELLKEHFNSVTAEDQMKFDALQPSEGNFTYDTADQMVSFATSNGMQVRGHALVWHRQTPSWVFSGSGDQVLQRMRNHIQNVMQHFQGSVYAWDIVNEAIMDDGSYRTGDEEEGQKSGWYAALGESYIAEAFRAARQADPTVKLFYNDYYNYHPARRQGIYDMLQGLLEAGVPVDGVGLQCHLNLEPGTDPSEQSYHQTVENLETAIDMYASLGLEVQVTELDVSVYLRDVTYTPDMFYTPASFSAAIQEQQAERYREFFDMFRRKSDVLTSVTLWGIADDNTWLSEFDSGRQDFPLLFNTQQQPKPAFWAVVDFCP